jgi:hypothetical protein
VDDDSDFPEDDRGRIVFYSKSKPALPTFGAKESREGARPKDVRLVQAHRALASKYPDFRKMLSNFWVIPGGVDVHLGDLCRVMDMTSAAAEGGPEVVTFKTLEHAFHFAKLWKTGYKMKALKFSTNFGDPVGATTDGGAIKKAGGKSGVQKLTPEQVSTWAKVTKQTMAHLLRIKFNPRTSTTLTSMLLLTSPLELWHLRNPRSGNPAEALERWDFLEKWRADLGKRTRR